MFRKAVFTNVGNYFTEKSFNEVCQMLEKGEAVEMYVECIGHTRNRMVLAEYRKKLFERYQGLLVISGYDDNEVRLRIS